MRIYLTVALLLSLSPAIRAESTCSLCFYGPDNFAFDRAHHVYVVDSDHQERSRVLKLSEDGRKLAEWKPFHFVSGRDNGPEGITADRDGFIWVTDGGALQVLKMTPQGAVSMRVGGPSVFHDLGHVAIDGAGILYVSEGGANRIDVFSSSGELVHVWTREVGTTVDDWKRPEGIGVLPTGQIIVEDWGNRRLVSLSRDGVTQAVWERAGSGSGQWLNSAGIFTSTDGQTLVANISQHRIEVLSPAGDLVREIANDPVNKVFLEGPSSVAQGPDGAIYAADGKSIVKFDPSGKFQSRWQ